MVGRALVLPRLRTLDRIGQLTARCLGNQLCWNMGRWLVQNPDCMIEAGSLAVSYGISGSPNVLLPEGAAAASLDAGFLAKECLDRNPTGRNGFQPGAHGSKDPPTFRYSDRLPAGFHNGPREWDVYFGVSPDGSTIVYVGRSSNLPTRKKAHGARFSDLEPQTPSKLTEWEARAVEDALIRRCGRVAMGSGPLQNKRFEIADHHAYFPATSEWGNNWVDANLPKGCSK